MSTQLAQHRQAGASSPLSASDSGHLSQSPQSPSNSPASGSAQNSESQLSNVTLNSEDDHIPTVAKGRRDRDNVEIGHQWPPGFGLTRHPSEDSYGAAREAHGKLSDAAVTLFSTIAILATFLGGTQATLLPLFAPSSEAAKLDSTSTSLDSSIASTALYLGIFAICVHLTISVAATIFAIFMVVENVLVITSRQGDTKDGFAGGPILGEAARYHGHLRTPTTERSPRASATRITARMSHLLKILGVALVLGIFLTLVDVLLYAALQTYTAKVILLVLGVAFVLIMAFLATWVGIWGGMIQLKSVNREKGDTFYGYLENRILHWWNRLAASIEQRWASLLQAIRKSWSGGRQAVETEDLELTASTSGSRIPSHAADPGARHRYR